MLRAALLQRAGLRWYRVPTITTTRAKKGARDESPSPTSKARARSPAKSLTPEQKREYQRKYYETHRDSLIERNRSNRQQKSRLEKAGV